MITLNIECENTYKEKEFVDVVKTAKEILNFYLEHEQIRQYCCLKDYEFNSLTFDFLLCDGERTHQINKEYRNKDYAADIITFAVFADSDESERFILDGDINLGEIIIALDKIEENAKEKHIPAKSELAFFIAHGILHLLGFDHQSEKDYNFVVDFQKKALKSIGMNYD